MKYVNTRQRIEQLVELQLFLHAISPLSQRQRARASCWTSLRIHDLTMLQFHTQLIRAIQAETNAQEGRNAE